MIKLALDDFAGLLRLAHVRVAAQDGLLRAGPLHDGASAVLREALVYDRNLFLFNIQKQIYCTQIFTENLFNRKIKYITVANRNTLIFCLFLLFPWFVSVGLSVSFLFYTNEQQKMNRKPISCFCSVSTIQFSVATETKITERNKQ